MPLPSFLTRARRDPFGVLGYNQLLSALRWQLGVFGAEHEYGSGLHNTPEVPAACGSLIWNGSSYTIVSQTGGMVTTSLNGAQAVYNPTAGEVHISLGGVGGVAFPGDMKQVAVQVSPAASDGLSNPLVAGYQVEPSQNMVRVFLQAGTYGAGGNVWTAIDGNIDFAIYTSPQVGGASLDLGAPVLRGQGLRAPSRWNKLVQGLASFNGLFTAGHGLTGAHSAGVVAKAQGVFTYDSSAQAYTSSASNGIGSVTYVSDGLALVLLSPDLTLPLQIFPEPISANATPGAVLMYAPTATRVSRAFYVLSWVLVDHTSYVGPPPYTYDARWTLRSTSLALAVHGT